MKNLTLLISGSLTPIIAVSFVLAFILKFLGITIFADIENTKLNLSLLIYFLNTTGIMINIYGKNIYSKCCNVNKIFLFLLSFMYFSLNDVMFDVVYLGYVIIFAIAVISAFSLRYFISMKVLKQKPKLVLNMSSLLIDYTFVVFIALFGINSHITFIALFVGLFDFVYIILVTSLWLHLNKRFNMTQTDRK